MIINKDRIENKFKNTIVLLQSKALLIQVTPL